MPDRTDHTNQTPRFAADVLRGAVFDYGGVITPPMSQMRTTPPPGVDPEQLRAAFTSMMAHGNPDSAWARVERGEITLAAFGDAMDALAPGAGAAFGDLDNTPVRNLWPRQEMTSRIAKIRASGIATALCTNNIAEFRPIWSSRMELDVLFDHVVDSSAVGTRKPEPAIYQHVLTLLELPAANVIFVDDMQANLDAAAALGYQTLLVGEADDHFAVLDRLFGLQ